VTNPFEFTIPISQFDVTRLPKAARTPGTDAFEAAVASYYDSALSASAGRVLVRIDDSAIRVTCVPAEGAANPLEYAIRLLRRGSLQDGVGILEMLRDSRPDDPDVLFNLGMAYSDLGRLDEASVTLTEATRIEPGNAHAVVALGVAQQRAKQPEKAVETLRRALAIDPQNGYAHRNLAAALGNLKEYADAEEHFREAVRLLPTDQQARSGLAHCLEVRGDTDQADDVYEAAIALDPSSDLAEAARTARGRIGQSVFREKAIGDIRPDAMMYCAAAMELFDALPPEEAKAITMEVALLGRNGFDVNDSAKKYAIKSIPGKTFSGLHMVSMMYVGFKRIDPKLDVGFDLAREYEAALALQRK
jgi:Flp pilus assembly protein TadD